jgi:hypothetical protein
MDPERKKLLNAYTEVELPGYSGAGVGRMEILQRKSQARTTQPL